MKIVLLFSGEYSMSLTFKAGFEKLGHEVHIMDYHEFIRKFTSRLDHYGTLFPSRIRKYIRKRYLKQIQAGYLAGIRELKPDLVLAYNDQMIPGETVSWIKATGCRFAVYLADSPFFLHRRNHLFKILLNADHVFAPDTFWLKQLNTLGLDRTTFLIIGYNKQLFYSFDPDPSESVKYGADIFYLGSSYNTIWGNKRAYFLNLFTGMDFKFYGPPSWKKWFGEFPDLRDHFIENKTRLSDREVNLISNCCKIYPVDANPGLIHGIHARILDCIGSGILPIVEYRTDLDRVFHDVEIPVIRDYREAPELARQYLNDSEKREYTLNRLKAHLDTFYSPEQSMSFLISKIFL